MELRDYIEMGAKKAGSLTALGKLLDETQPHMSSAKGHHRTLTIEACVTLAQLINVEPFHVIAANKAATEKDEKKRAFWSPFVQHAKAASIALAISLVTSFVTPSPAEAAPTQNVGPDRLCIMLIRRVRHHLKQAQLLRAMLPFIKRLIEAITPTLQRRIA